MFSIPFASNPHVHLTTSSPLPVHTSLTIPNTGYVVNKTVSQSTPADIRLSVDVVGIVGLMRGDGKVYNKTIIVRSEEEVSVHVINREFAAGDGYVVYPISHVGTEYYVASYTPYHPIYPSFFCISSPYDNTLVNIKTKAGKSHSVNLMQYESFRFDGEDYEDLSGTFVQGNKPIAVISGVFTKIPTDVCCSDSIIEQLVSTNYWSTSYILSPFQTLDSGYIYRVYSMNTNTTLSISDKLNTVQLGAESFYEGGVTGDKLVTVTANYPVMIVQYIKGWHTNDPYRGDPSMVIIPPVTSFAHDIVTFPVIEFTNYHEHYINVITECDNVDGLLFDNTITMRDWERLTTDDQVMCCVRGSVTTGQHSVSHTDPMAPFSVLVYAICKTCGSSSSYAASLFYIIAGKIFLIFAYWKSTRTQYPNSA